MFSPRTYWRLVELYNRDVWPLQLIAAAAGLLALWLAATRPAARRIVAALLALAWLWVGWAFHWQRYATINLAAPYLAGACWLQAALLVIVGVASHSGPGRPANAVVRGLGWVLASGGLLLYPLAGLAAGRPWAQAEVFGVMPEPTALATLGLLLAGGLPHARSLSVLPAISLLAGMANLWMLSG
jgi:hypothetical protein